MGIMQGGTYWTLVVLAVVDSIIVIPSCSIFIVLCRPKIFNRVVFSMIIFRVNKVIHWVFLTNDGKEGG